MRGVELVVLDLAGTTVEDGGCVAGAFTSALAEHGIAVSSEDLDAYRGASKRQAIAELVRTHKPDAGDRFVRTVYDGSQAVEPGAWRRRTSRSRCSRIHCVAPSTRYQRGTEHWV